MRFPEKISLKQLEELRDAYLTEHARSNWQLGEALKFSAITKKIEEIKIKFYQ